MSMDPTAELLKDATVTIEAVLASVIEQRSNAANAAADAATAVANGVAAAKAAIESIPNIPAFAKGLLESDALLQPLVTDVMAMVEKTLGQALDKLEGKA